MLLERNGKLTKWKSKSSRLSHSLVESLPLLSMMNVRYGFLPQGAEEGAPLKVFAPLKFKNNRKNNRNNSLLFKNNGLLSPP